MIHINHLRINKCWIWKLHIFATKIIWLNCAENKRICSLLLADEWQLPNISGHCATPSWPAHYRALPLPGVTTDWLWPPCPHRRTDPGVDDDLRIHPAGHVQLRCAASPDSTSGACRKNTPPCSVKMSLLLEEDQFWTFAAWRETHADKTKRQNETKQQSFIEGDLNIFRNMSNVNVFFSSPSLSCKGLLPQQQYHDRNNPNWSCCSVVPLQRHLTTL